MKYRNRKNEWVSVSEEHLQTALKIKQELQKASPSMKCPWGKHKSLMAQEGFDDSDNNEAYRQMIKRYQKSVGELPSAQEYADMVSEGTLESIKNEIGELAWQKREVQHETRKLGKIKREIIDDGLLIKELSKSVKEVFGKMNLESIVKYAPSPISRGKSKLLALVTDWHIGADVDVVGNRYNYSIAKKRVHEFTDKLLRIADERDTDQIEVIYMGDMVEGGYMRGGQAYGIEFPVSEQMARGGELIIEMLSRLSQKYQTRYRGFAGNHDRMNQGDKNGNIHGDTAMVVVNKIVKVFIETSKLDGLKYEDTHNYSASLIDVNGRNIKLVHGDHERRDDKNKIARHSFNDGVNYDIIAYGHFHHFMNLEIGMDKLEVRVGSIKGSDDYSETLQIGSSPSQCVVVIDGDGEIEVKRVRLS